MRLLCDLLAQSVGPALEILRVVLQGIAFRLRVGDDRGRGRRCHLLRRRVRCRALLTLGLDSLPHTVNLHARGLEIMRPLIKILRALRHLLLQLLRLTLQNGDLSTQCIEAAARDRAELPGADCFDGPPPIMATTLSDRSGSECRSPSAPAKSTSRAAIMVKAGNRKRHMRPSPTGAYNGVRRGRSAGETAADRATDISTPDLVQRTANGS